MNNLVLLLIMALICMLPSIVNASDNGEKILFIPHDSRPISLQQTAEVIEQLGYEVLTPPEELFGGSRTNYGNGLRRMQNPPMLRSLPQIPYSTAA